MNSDELIRTLAAEMRPVQRLRGVDTRTRLWAAVALACVCIGTVVLGTRVDLAGRLRDPAFLAEGAALLLVFVVSGRSAFHLSVPGSEGRKLARALPFVGLLAWLVLIAVRHASAASEAVELAGLSCVWRMAFLALAPTLTLLFMLRRAAPLERGWAGLFALLSAGSLALLGTLMICAKDEPLHVLVWHFAPLVLAGLAGIGLGRSSLGRASDGR